MKNMHCCQWVRDPILEASMLCVFHRLTLTAKQTVTDRWFQQHGLYSLLNTGWCLPFFSSWFQKNYRM